MKKTVLLLIILSLISKVIGLGREITLSYFYGTSSISDAYLIAIIIPTVVFEFLGIAIATGYIPMYNKIQNTQGEKKADQYTNNLINILLILCSLVIILGLLFTDQIVMLFAPGFNEETFKLAVSFTKVSILGVYFTVLVYVMRSFIQIKGNFAIPALIGLPMNLIIIMSILISSKDNVMILSVGILLGMFSQFVFLVPLMVKKGFKYKLVIDLKDSNIKKMLLLALPILIGVAVNDINKIVDKSLASQITSGGISALTYAITLTNVIQGIFVLSISTAMYPMISKMSVEKNYVGLKKTVSEAISIINLLVIPVTVGIMIFVEPIIILLYGRGSFGVDSIEMTSNALFFYSIGMLAFGLREVLSKPFYAMQDTLTPMINASVGVVLNIILCIILSKYMGIGGLALATSISAFITTGLMFHSLRKKIGRIGLKKISIPFLKILSASIIMGIIAEFSFQYLLTITNSNISLLISIVIGAISYFIIIYFMKVRDIEIIVNVLKRKMSKKSEAV